VAGQACAVDQAGDCAELLSRRREQGLHVVLARDVGADRDTPNPFGRGRRDDAHRGGVIVSIADREVVPGTS
jgi:hypothetical protein